MTGTPRRCSIEFQRRSLCSADRKSGEWSRVEAENRFPSKVRRHQREGVATDAPADAAELEVSKMSCGRLDAVVASDMSQS